MVSHEDISAEGKVTLCNGDEAVTVHTLLTFLLLDLYL